MKIYEQTPAHLVRLQICKIKEQTMYLTLCETTPEEVEMVIKNLITGEKLSPFQTGNLTSINIRESWGGKNGKSKSISFKGINAENTYNLIVNHLKK